MRAGAGDSGSQLLDWLPQLTISEGRRAGENLTVMPWQAEFIRGAFAPDVLTGALSIGRGNGKSTTAAAIACAYIAGPLARERGEVVVVAGVVEQAAIIARHVLAFLRKGIAEGLLTVRERAGAYQILRPDLGARLVVRGGRARSLHGLAPSLVLMDEPAAWSATDRESKLAALTTAAGKQPDCRLIALGTRDDDETSWWSSWCDRDRAHHFRQVHAAPADCELTDESAQIAANPSMPFFPDLARAIRMEASACDSASAVAAFRALRLNQGVSEVAESVLIEAEAWARCETDRLPVPMGGYVLGLDLGGSSSMTAAAAYWWSSDRLEARAWVGSEPSLRRRGRADGVGNLYSRMSRRGELAVVGGRVPPVADVLREVVQTWGPPVVIACDRYRQGELLDGLQAAGLGPEVVWRGQGYKDQGEDVRRFQSAVLGERVAVSPSLLVRAALRSSRLQTDPAGNQKVNRVGRRVRTDAAMAVLLAVSEGDRRRATARERFRYVGLAG